MAQNEGKRIGRNAMYGAVAGVAGTAAMTVLMKPGLARYLSRRWRPEEFVPKQIVRWGERAVGAPRALPERQEMLAAMVLHLGYGAAMGAVYGALRGDRNGMRPVLTGGAWGVLVWAIGYEGWLPALGVRPATTDQPTTKWPLPIANHILYGGVTGVVFHLLMNRLSGGHPKRRTHGGSGPGLR